MDVFKFKADVRLIIREVWKESGYKFELSPTLNRIEQSFYQISTKPIMIKTLDDLLSIICNEYKVPISVIKGESQIQEYITIRKTYAYLAKQLWEDHSPRMTLTKIGTNINRDYSTIIHYLKTMEAVQCDEVSGHIISKLYLRIHII